MHEQTRRSRGGHVPVLVGPAGVTLPELKELLGQSSLAIALRYAHLAPEHLRSAVTRLDGVLEAEEASRSGARRAQEVVESPRRAVTA
jgi:hypothetical protein